MKYGKSYLFIKTLRCQLLKKPDLERWQDLENFDPKWDERAILMASLIPVHTRVIEFGAGRRNMETHINPSCTYFPSDIISRGRDTIICDLNVRPFPDLGHLKLDVAVFGGVLEYVPDLSPIAIWLAKNVSMCIASYECAHSKPKTFQRLVERVSRLRIGWVNTYNEQEIETIFALGGFFCSKKITWETNEGDERIFFFRKPLHINKD